MRIEVSGTREVVAVLEGMQARTRDLSPALGQVADWLAGQMQEAFDTAGGNLPKPWAPLASDTRDAKAARGLDPRVLVRRGDLMGSLADRGHARHRETITDDELRFGTRSPVVPLLRYHGRDPIQVPRDMEPAARIVERGEAEGIA